MTGGSSGASREQAGAVCLIMDSRLYFKLRRKKEVHLPFFLLRLVWILSKDPSMASFLFTEGNEITALFIWWSSVFFFFSWWVLMQEYWPLTASRSTMIHGEDYCRGPGKFFLFFCICQVFNANLPLLVTSAFPSSRLHLFFAEAALIPHRPRWSSPYLFG